MAETKTHRQLNRGALGGLFPFLCHRIMCPHKHDYLAQRKLGA